ncbi:hypothetical protein K1T71_004158 [Dendrolimus kikuchii]|uniref:Uncharacterized protein n=1 Tax=Dendrolimus kikuchii TaxID=765133 RepID=A0ACC1D9W3_9NEOP|nr:hypothetical protein K1T71_004158 [Dendrolimus kikuchii]
MGKIVLYNLEASPPSNAVRTLCDMLAIDLEIKDLDFINLEHKSEEFMKINPMGTVPAIRDEDFDLSESNAIMIYLLSKYGNKSQQESLYPSDVNTRAVINQIMHFNTGVYFVRLKVIVLPAVFGDSPGPTQKMKDDVDLAYGVVESYLKGRKYIATDHMTLADLAAGTTTAAVAPLHKLEPERFPLTTEWLARLYEEPSFKKFITPCVQVLDQIVNTCWERNKSK